jgi:dihydrofolate reductase
VGEALERLEGYNGQAGETEGNGEEKPEIERVFVIGGATIYDAALGLPQTERVLLTKIETEYECDTFFSVDLDESGEWKRSSKEELEGWTRERTEVVEEKGVRFEFGMYEKVGR